jgi:murein L,D-transpeptidase YcbB/YkuD
MTIRSRVPYFVPVFVLVAIALLAGGPAAAGETAALPLRDNQGPQLEEALRRYRDIERRGGWESIPESPAMGPPYSYDCRLIAALERRLIVEDYLDRLSPRPAPPALPPGQKTKPSKVPPAPPLCEYGPALTAAMRAFQADRHVLGDGQFGRLTRVQLNRPVEEIVHQLEHDVARWRGVATHPSGSYLLVNIPFFELSVFERGRETMRMPVVVGQKTWPTPQFSDQVEYLIVNPDWGIPDKIAKQEYWPQARRDPKYLARQGITANGGGLRQKPGPRNPLGRIKFVMPNPHDVYLHDTPEQRAFPAAVRALSHGCVRLSRPIDLAAYLLRNEPQWSEKRIRDAIASGQTRQIDLRSPVPVHIVYSTTRINEAGRVEVRADVYGKNGRRPRIEEPLAAPEDLEADAGP